MTDDSVFARWETKDRAYFVEIEEMASGEIFYNGRGTGASLGRVPRDEAVRLVEDMIRRGFFLPQRRGFGLRRVR